MITARARTHQRLELARARSLVTGPGYEADDRHENAKREHDRPEGSNSLPTCVTRASENGICLFDGPQEPTKERICHTSSPGRVHAPADPTNDRSDHHQDDPHDEDGHAWALLG
jgi:hypothetical protein